MIWQWTLRILQLAIILGVAVPLTVHGWADPEMSQRPLFVPVVAVMIGIGIAAIIMAIFYWSGRGLEALWRLVRDPGRRAAREDRGHQFLGGPGRRDDRQLAGHRRGAPHKLIE